MVVSKRYVGRHVLFVSLLDGEGGVVDILLKSAAAPSGNVQPGRWQELKRIVRVGDVMTVDVGAREEGKGKDGADVLHAMGNTIHLSNGDTRGTPAALGAHAQHCQHPQPSAVATAEPASIATGVSAVAVGGGRANADAGTAGGGGGGQHDEVIRLLLSCSPAELLSKEAAEEEEEDDEEKEEQKDLQEPALPMPTEALFAHNAMHVAERSRVFAWWAIQIYFGELGKGGYILDVAGGVGELSLLFALSGIPARLVDPRGGNLPKRQRKQLRRSGQPPFARHAELFGIQGSRRGRSATARLLRGVSLVLGLHPDEATDAIVDAAIAARIPFAVVPCCCFSRKFPHRRLSNGARVHTTTQLCEYLLEKHPAVRALILPMRGQNRCIYVLDYEEIGVDTDTLAVKRELREASLKVENGSGNLCNADDEHQHHHHHC